MKIRAFPLNIPSKLFINHSNRNKKETEKLKILFFFSTLDFSLFKDKIPFFVTFHYFGNLPNFSVSVRCVDRRCELPADSNQ